VNIHNSVGYFTYFVMQDRLMVSLLRSLHVTFEPHDGFSLNLVVHVLFLNANNSEMAAV
jgi:hypothetical protein